MANPFTNPNPDEDIEELKERIKDLEQQLIDEENEHEEEIERIEREAGEVAKEYGKRPDPKTLSDVIAVARHVYRETTPHSFDLLSYEEQEQKYAEARAALEFRWP